MAGSTRRIGQPGSHATPLAVDQRSDGPQRIPAGFGCDDRLAGQGALRRVWRLGRGRMAVVVPANGRFSAHICA